MVSFQEAWMMASSQQTWLRKLLFLFYFYSIAGIMKKVSRDSWDKVIKEKVREVVIKKKPRSFMVLVDQWQKYEVVFSSGSRNDLFLEH